MKKLAAPFVSRRSLREGTTPFNEGVQVPQADFDKLALRKPALKSTERLERSEALTKEILHGDLGNTQQLVDAKLSSLKSGLACNPYSHRVPPPCIDKNFAKAQRF